MSAAPLQRFVRSAWMLLLFQLVAAVFAVGVTGWAAFQVRPLFGQREQLVADVAALGEEKKALETQRQRLVATNQELAERLTRSRQEARVRAADFIHRGVTSYHARDYAAAIANYDRALELDPGNAYVLDLKSYSQFRAGDLDGAIASITMALSGDPSYVYGYSELTRYACAARQFERAVETYTRAKRDHPDVVGLFARLLRDDGQFARLCGPVRDQFS